MHVEPFNALKHAFPDERTGTIMIDYRSLGAEWTLSITDNGIGMPMGSDAPKAGLGSGIVEALTRNLGAEIRVSNASPGTAVTISREGSADVRKDLPAAA